MNEFFPSFFVLFFSKSPALLYKEIGRRERLMTVKIFLFSALTGWRGTRRGGPGDNYTHSPLQLAAASGNMGPESLIFSNIGLCLSFSEFVMCYNSIVLLDSFIVVFILPGH